MVTATVTNTTTVTLPVTHTVTTTETVTIPVTYTTTTTAWHTATETVTTAVDGKESETCTWCLYVAIILVVLIAICLARCRNAYTNRKRLNRYGSTVYT
jgi:hypothetical protein